MPTTDSPRRRRPPGRSGGKPVSTQFFIVKGEGTLYPDEGKQAGAWPSVMPDTFRMSWMWALDYLDQHRDHWLRVPMKSPPDTLLYEREKNSIRASIWRTAGRNGHELESMEWKQAMWFRVIDL